MRKLVTPDKPYLIAEETLPTLVVRRQLGGASPIYCILCIPCFNRQLRSYTNHSYEVITVNTLPYKCDICSQKSDIDPNTIYADWVTLQCLIIDRVKGGQKMYVCTHCAINTYWDSSKTIIVPQGIWHTPISCEFCNGTYQERLFPKGT
jgi:hypothetical protein